MSIWSTFGRRWAALPYAIFDRNPLVQSGGIQFPATQVPSSDANTLDDYEEGTFTPTIEGTTTAGAATYTSQTGFYVKIGKVVFVHILMGWSAHTGTGNLVAAGLPFTISLSTATFVIRPNNLSWTAGSIPLTRGVNGTTTIILEQAAPGGAVAPIPMDTSASVIITGWYFAPN